MDANPDFVIERLWNQMRYWNPQFNDNTEQKLLITKKLQAQLVDGRAVVRVKTLEVAYDELHKSCENKIKELKLILEKANAKKTTMEEDFNSDSECKEEDIKVEASEDSDSENEQLSVVAKKCRRSKGSNDVVQLPLALSKTPRKRKKSSNFKYVEISPVKTSKQVRAKGRGKRPVIYCCEEDAECNRESHHSLHIEIPRLFLQGRRHHLYLGNKLSEETFADMAREAKQRAQEMYPKCSTQHTNQKKGNTITTVCSSSVDNAQQTSDEVEFSQLVRDIMPGDGSDDETWQAARALECINNNVLDNLDTSMEGFFTFPLSAQETPICCEPTSKRRRKSLKPNSEGQPVKRGRKPKNRDSLLVQPPTKSNLAQYVENFSNDCAMPGSATPAASSTMSQPLVTSTTHNFEFIDQQDPGTVMCYIEGDWANGGSCQLVTTNGLSINNSQMQPENMNGTTLPFQENTLDGNLGLSMSAPLTSYEFSNLTQTSSMQQNAELQNAFTHPIINIQIPTLPTATTTISASAEECIGVQPPLPAHIISNCVLDLSVKSKTADTVSASIDMANLSNNSNASLKYTNGTDDDDAAAPLDLSLKAASNQNITSTSVTTELDTVLSESHYVVEHNGQYYDFARCLDELEFDRPDKQYKGKDMPLLDCNNEQEDILIRDSTKSLSIDSNYISMNEDKSEIHSCILGQEFQFANESTKEIFDNLFEIGSLTAVDGENMNRNNDSFLALDTETFNCSEIQSSTLSIPENTTKDKIDDKDKTNDQGINMDVVIKDVIVSCVNITDTYVNKSSSTLEEIINGQSKVVQKCEPRFNDGTLDSQQKNLDNVTKDIAIPVIKCADTSSTVEENTTTTSGTRKVTEKFIPRILKRCHIAVNKLDPTKCVEKVKDKEYEEKPREKILLEKTSEVPNDKKQEKCVNVSKQMSETTQNSTGNIPVANMYVVKDDAITSSHILNQCQLSILDSVTEDSEVVVVSDGNVKNIMDECVHKTFNSRSSTLNESYSSQYVRKSDQKSPGNMEITQSKSLEETTKSESLDIPTNPISYIAENGSVLSSNVPAIKVSSSSKKLDETPVIENVGEKPVIKAKEIAVIGSSKECEKDLQLQKFDADSNESIGKIVFSVKRVDLSDETNSLDYTFENCEISRKSVSQADSSLSIENNKLKLFDSSTNTNMNVNDSGTEHDLKDPENHYITNNINNAKEPIIKTPNVDLRYVPYKSPKCSSSQHKDPESEQLKDDVTVLNLATNSGKEWKEVVYELEDVTSNCKNPTKISSSLTTQCADTENPSSCQNLGNINLEKSSLLATSNHVQTVKHLDTGSDNDIRNYSQNEENYKDHNPNDENKCDTNCISVVTPKNTTLDLPNMSLLEMESKLEEDNLDFEEDFDDALSLATSCFDSPNENRFMESLVYESDSSTNDVSTPENTITSSNTIPNLATKPSLEDLRNFKIPKFKKFPSAERNKQEGTTKMSITCKDIAHINHFTLQPSVRLEKISINKEGNIVRKENGKVAVSSKVLNSITTKVENISRTITNESGNGNANAVTISGILSRNQQQHSQSQQKMLQTIKCIINNNSSIISNQQPPLSTNGGNVLSNDSTQKIYGITCLPHLVDRCLKSETHCQYSHQLNDNDTVFKSLNSLNKLQLIEAYCFMYNHQKLYKSYFLVFCNLYTIRRDRNKLLYMAIDCERYPQYSEFLIALYEGLVKCGLSRINACRHILQRFKERSVEFIDALVAIIMKSDWTMFADYIESFAQGEHNFRFSTLEHMSQAVLHTNNEHLKEVFGKCVQMLHSDDTALLVTSPNVIQWVNLFIKP